MYMERFRSQVSFDHDGQVGGRGLRTLGIQSFNRERDRRSREFNRTRSTVFSRVRLLETIRRRATRPIRYIARKNRPRVQFYVITSPPTHTHTGRGLILQFFRL